MGTKPESASPPEAAAAAIIRILAKGFAVNFNLVQASKQAKQRSIAVKRLLLFTPVGSIFIYYHPIGLT